MARRQINLSKPMLFVWLLLAGLIILFTPSSVTSKFQFAFVRVFSWPLSMGRSMSLAAVPSQPGGDVITRHQYDQLQNHLQNVLAWSEELQLKYDKLAGIRGRYPALSGTAFVSADITKSISSGAKSSIIINRGKNDGLAVGQFVLAQNSIIGTISYVDSRMAHVKLITDATSMIGVKVKPADVKFQKGKTRPGFSAIMAGTGTAAKLINVKSSYKVGVGDIVYADKKTGQLDIPIIAGTVTDCRVDDAKPLFWKITIRPACDFSTLRDVAIIIMNPKTKADKK